MTFKNFLKFKMACLCLALSLFSLASWADSSEQESTNASSYLLMEASTSSSSINWDIDDNGQADALTDGLMFLRYAFGLNGDSLAQWFDFK